MNVGVLRGAIEQVLNEMRRVIDALPSAATLW